MILKRPIIFRLELVDSETGDVFMTATNSLLSPTVDLAVEADVDTILMTLITALWGLKINRII